MEVPSSGVTPPAMAGGKRILVVDDDPAITELVRERLEREGFFVAVCHDTLAAEHYLQVEHPDLIVLDVIMPGGDGIEFCRKIRSDPHQQAVPIIFFSVKGELQDKLVGFATGADDYLPKPFELEELVARIHALLTRLESFKDWAWRDELTRVYNRRYLHRRLEEEVARAQRSNGRFSLAMIDIDLFKNVNDSFGHRVGDEVLRFLVARMTETLRVADVICRYGGEEFVVILPDTPLPEGHLALERLRQAVQAEPLELPGSPMRIPFTISAGVAGFPEDGCTGEELLDAADTAMYRAKEAGRNTVLLSREVVK
ncbi:hypothetical protein SY88_03465 [Clostridiales bacterium PH28_bin88]|nr:hypothetical protein SY88_03465 [Clostridiales bacterium PH28_bin88]